MPGTGRVRQRQVGTWTIRALSGAESAPREYQGIGRDITEKKVAAARIKNYIRNMEFLARTSATFADVADDENIYQYMADRIARSNQNLT